MDFRQIVTEIYATGLNDSEIAKIVRSTQPTITRLRNGVARKTSYELGTALVNLHRIRCLNGGEPKADEPKSVEAAR
jgi:hypothetical protein